MPPPEKEPLKDVTMRDHTESRMFRYQRNNINLSFTLRIDIKQELKDFSLILDDAKKDVQAQLDSMK